MRYRQGFRRLPWGSQDRDLLWIFGGGADEELLAPNLGEQPATTMELTSPTASSEPSSMEATSLSTIEEGNPMAERQEDTSASDSAEAEGAANPRGTTLEASMESTSSSSSMPPLVSDDDPATPAPAPKRRRQYTSRRRGGWPQPTVPVQGVLTRKSLSICRKAAEFLIGVGSPRVQRVLSGRADGRLKGMRLPNSGVPCTSSPRAVCLRFLWRKYHFDAEGLPDRFSLQWHDAETLTIGPNQTLVPARSASSAQDFDADRVQEEEARAIAGLALYISSAHEPNSMISLGPGAHGGPVRYIGVVKPIHLYLELEAWCAVQNIPKPSFNTLLRALDQCKCIRFRKTAGQHPNCDKCMEFKLRLRAPQHPNQRAHVLEEYCQHIFLQWCDRGMDANCTELSRTCRRMLDMGALLISMARHASFWLIRVDGVDQAKFRVPRCAMKTHAFDKLIRPALHVQGAWCEGFGYHFAVADADLKKDTNNNIEVVARLMEALYKRHGALPLAISLIQDNTCRECKNQKILKFGARLIALDILESISLLYPEKGHTHGPLDATFGQMCVKLSLEEFQDDLDVVAILDDFLRTSGLDEATRQDAMAYKLDEAPEWDQWALEVDLSISALTGPQAPHYFRCCHRRHLGTHHDAAAEAAACHRADHRGYQPSGGDVVLVVKDRMASIEVSQIILMLPAADLGRIHGLPLQPRGTHPRRAASDADRRRVFEAARAAWQAGAIQAKACDYLTDWSRGTRRRQPRPSQYDFLRHRVPGRSEPNAVAPDPPALRSAARPVIVAAMGENRGLPVDPEPDDDHDPGQLVIA